MLTPKNEFIHPELLTEIPEGLRERFVNFMATGKGDQEVTDFFNSSTSAQEILELYMENRENRLALETPQRVDNAGGVFQYSQGVSQVLGIPLDSAIRITLAQLNTAERLKGEQDEIDEEGGTKKG